MKINLNKFNITLICAMSTCFINDSNACTQEALMRYSQFTYSEQANRFMNDVAADQLELESIREQSEQIEPPTRGSDYNGSEYVLVRQAYLQTMQGYQQSIENISQKIQCDSRFAHEFHRLSEQEMLLKSQHSQCSTELEKAALTHQIDKIFKQITSKLTAHPTSALDHLIAHEFPPLYSRLIDSIIPQNNEDFKKTYADIGRYSTDITTLSIQKNRPSSRTHPYPSSSRTNPNDFKKLVHNWKQFITPKMDALRLKLPNDIEEEADSEANSDAVILFKLYQALLEQIQTLEH